MRGPPDTALPRHRRSSGGEAGRRIDPPATRPEHLKILNTGGAGFIGSHLAEALLARGDKVAALDDLSTGSVSNVQHLRDSPDFSLRVGSCLDKPLVAELVDLADVTVHLAAAVGVRLIVERPVHTIETNVRATEVVLEAAARKGKKVFDCGPEEPCRLTTPRPRAGLPEAKPSRPRSSRSYGATSSP